MTINDDTEIKELLAQMVMWTQFANRRAILETWDSVLSDDLHLLAYELSDGSRTQTQVANESGLSQPTLSGLWTKWKRLGIARNQGSVVVHLARPSDFGVERAMRLITPKAKTPAAKVPPSA